MYNVTFFNVGLSSAQPISQPVSDVGGPSAAVSFATAPSASLPIAAPNSGAAVFVVTALVVRTAAVVVGPATARVVAGVATVVGAGASVVVGEAVVDIAC